MALLTHAVKLAVPVICLIVPNASFYPHKASEADSSNDSKRRSRRRTTAFQEEASRVAVKAMMLVQKNTLRDRPDSAVSIDFGSKLQGAWPFPENAWNKYWDPYVPEVATVFDDPPIVWVDEYPEACMGVLTRRVASILGRCLERTPFDYVGTLEVVAVGEDSALQARGRDASAADARLSLIRSNPALYDVYLCNKLTEQPQAAASITAVLEAFGLRVCKPR